MEKFNPNKKNWEPLCGDTSVKKYAPEPKKQYSHFRVNGRNRKYGHLKDVKGDNK